MIGYIIVPISIKQENKMRPIWINEGEFGWGEGCGGWGLKLIIITLLYFEDLPGGHLSDLDREVGTLRRSGHRNDTLNRCLFCLLWIYFTICSGVSAVDFEQVNAHWVALFGNSHRDVLTNYCFKFVDIIQSVLLREFIF